MASIMEGTPGLGAPLVEDMDSATDNLLDIQWGSGLSFVTLGGRTVAHFESRVADGLPDTGRIQLPYGPEAGQGYGYSYAIARLYPNEGGGPAVLEWPGDNRWPGFELDMVEATSRDGVFSTHHRPAVGVWVNACLRYSRQTVCQC